MKKKLNKKTLVLAAVLLIGVLTGVAYALSGGESSAPVEVGQLLSGKHYIDCSTNRHNIKIY